MKNLIQEAVAGLTSLTLLWGISLPVAIEDREQNKSELYIKQNQRTHELPAITKEQEVLLQKLRMCESSGNDLLINENDGGIGKHSRGRYQFQMATFKQEVRRFNLLDENNLEEVDWYNWIWSGDFQELLVRKMLLSEENQWRHWFNCGKRIKLHDFYGG